MSVRRPNSPGYAFEWKVPEGGYRWSFQPRPFALFSRDAQQEIRPPGEGISRHHEVLVPAISPTHWRTYMPLREFTGLFIVASRLEPSPEAILAFANKYGSLHKVAAPTEGDSSYESSWGDGMTAPSWADAIGELRTAVRFWELARESHTQRDELRREAENAINDALRSLMIFRDLQIELNDASLQPIPRTLLGAIWTQFLLAFTYEKEYRQCPARGCPREWFEVSRRNAATRPTTYCSSRCRHRDWLDSQRTVRGKAKTGTVGGGLRSERAGKMTVGQQRRKSKPKK